MTPYPIAADDPHEKARQYRRLFFWLLLLAIQILLAACILSITGSVWIAWWLTGPH